MYSGLALLMDVHYPEKSNGYGVILVNGSGWLAPLGYDDVGLKERGGLSAWLPPMMRGGYTVFSINHRAAPRFHYPTAVEDVQRAVRFVRHHSKQYGISPSRLGAMGHSSGGHLIGLVAMLGAGGIPDDPDPVNHEPATIECLVLRSAATDLRRPDVSVALFMNFDPSDTANQKVLAAASPIMNVSRNAPPVLLLHGDSDKIVSVQQSVAMEAALRGANVPVKLVRVVGGGHAVNFGTADMPHAQFPEVLREMVRWLDQYLSATPGSSAK
jgi:acetyl esterase/lipase